MGISISIFREQYDNILSRKAVDILENVQFWIAKWCDVKSTDRRHGECQKQFSHCESHGLKDQ